MGETGVVSHSVSDRTVRRSRNIPPGTLFLKWRGTAGLECKGDSIVGVVRVEAVTQ